MPQGTIKKVVLERGFGFISGDRGDVFFHHTSLVGTSFDSLQEGQVVEYELESDVDARRSPGKGPKASSVKPA
jgi:CspA family cold shock protein